MKYLDKTSQHTDESIYSRQNKRDILLLLKSQQEEYSRAKRLLYFGAYSSIFASVVFSILTSLIDSELLRSISFLMAMLIFAASTVCENLSKNIVESAAKIQQTIDTRLFNISDRSHILRASEEVEVTAKYQNSDLSNLMNWYSDYSGLSFQKQVFFSQKENIRWDKNLRKKYYVVIVLMTIGCPILLLLYAVLKNITTLTLFAIASWLFPLEQFLIKQWIGITESIKYLDSVNQRTLEVDGLFNTLSVDAISCNLCSLQTAIYESRKKATLIPDWMHRKTRKKLQRFEDSIAGSTCQGDSKT